jgi:hypothetical protein
MDRALSPYLSIVFYFRLIFESNKGLESVSQNTNKEEFMVVGDLFHINGYQLFMHHHATKVI